MMTADLTKLEIKAIQTLAIELAFKEIGKGEFKKNNSGEDIARYSGGKQNVNWCAYFVNYCYEQACLRLQLPMPYILTPKTKAGAKATMKAMAAVGSKFKNPLLAKPGDFVVWNRPPIGWQGHIGLVVAVDKDGIITTLEGNVGKFPAKVKKLTHDVTKMDLYYFATLRSGVK